MDYQRRRKRRGRTRMRTAVPLHVARPQKRSFLKSFYNFLIMSSLIIIVYLMLDYQCNMCNKKYDIHNITRSIYDITQNVTVMKNSYCDLESTIQKISSELPKIESQIEVLEVLANNMKKTYIWNPKKHLPLPNVDVFLKNIGKGATSKRPEIGNITESSFEPIKIGKD